MGRGAGYLQVVPIKMPFSQRLPRNVSDTIFEGVREFAESWKERAKEGCPDAPDELILDDAFYDLATKEVRVNQTDFVLNQPNVVGYVPYPLLFQCGIVGPSGNTRASRNWPTGNYLLAARTTNPAGHKSTWYTHTGTAQSSR